MITSATLLMYIHKLNIADFNEKKITQIETLGATLANNLSLLHMFMIFATGASGCRCSIADILGKHMAGDGGGKDEDEDYDGKTCMSTGQGTGTGGVDIIA